MTRSEVHRVMEFALLVIGGLLIALGVVAMKRHAAAAGIVFIAVAMLAFTGGAASAWT
jgi:hypothetical protein